MNNFNYLNQHLGSWNPFKEFEQLQHRLSTAFGRGELLPGTAASGTPSQESLAMADWAPRVDILEDTEKYLLKIDLPEVKKEDVKVTIKDGVLSLQGERQLEKEERNKKYHRIEKAYGSFFRSFRLPEDVDAKNIDASFKDGVLSVSLAKAPMSTAGSESVVKIQ
jgi:HSP20 family protein